MQLTDIIDVDNFIKYLTPTLLPLEQQNQAELIETVKYVLKKARLDLSEKYGKDLGKGFLYESNFSFDKFCQHILTNCNLTTNCAAPEFSKEQFQNLYKTSVLAAIQHLNWQQVERGEISEWISPKNYQICDNAHQHNLGVLNRKKKSKESKEIVASESIMVYKIFCKITAIKLFTYIIYGEPEVKTPFLWNKPTYEEKMDSLQFLREYKPNLSGFLPQKEFNLAALQNAAQQESASKIMAGFDEEIPPKSRTVLGNLSMHTAMVNKFSDFYCREARLEASVKFKPSPNSLWMGRKDKQNAMHWYGLVTYTLEARQGFTGGKFLAQASRLGYIAQQFPATLIKDIMEILKLKKKNSPLFAPIPTIKNVYDPCYGWLDRLTGMLTYLPQLEQIWVNDVNKELVAPCQQLYTDYPLPAKHKIAFKVTTEKAENLTKNLYTEKNLFFQFIIAGLPFFSDEIYPGENQSTSNYPQFNDWIKNFLEPVIYYSLAILQPGGIFALNLADALITKTKKVVDKNDDFIEKEGVPIYRCKIIAKFLQAVFSQRFAANGITISKFETFTLGRNTDSFIFLMQRSSEELLWKFPTDIEKTIIGQEDLPKNNSKPSVFLIQRNCKREGGRVVEKKQSVYKKIKLI